MVNTTTNANNVETKISGLEMDLQTYTTQVNNAISILGDNLDVLYETKQDVLSQSTDIQVANITSGIITVNAVSDEVYNGLLTSVDENGNITFGPITSNTNVAIKTLDGAIVASKFITLSDARVKKDVIPLQNRNLIDKMTPVCYRYKDTICHGDKEHLGFIAQDLEDIDARFVCSQSGRIPNISRMCICEGDTLVLNTKGIDITTGTTLEIYVDGSTKDVVVAGISEGAIHLTDTVSAHGKCFIIGTVVEDILTVDSMAIIAEVVNEVKNLKREIECLKMKNTVTPR